jgi:hypothetical protein
MPRLGDTRARQFQDEMRPQGRPSSIWPFVYFALPHDLIPAGPTSENLADVLRILVRIGDPPQSESQPPLARTSLEFDANSRTRIFLGSFFSVFCPVSVD